MKNNFSIFRNSLLFIFTLSLITSSLVAFPAATRLEKAEADEISADPRIATAPVLFNAKASHPDMGDTDEPKIIVEFNQEYMNNKNEYDNQSIVLYNIRTGVYQDSTYRWDRNKIELDIPKFAGQGINLYQVYLIDYDDYESLSAAENILGKSNIVMFERKNPITINLWSEPWADSVRFEDIHYELNQHINGDDYRVEVFNTTMDTRASFDNNWSGWRKTDKLDWVDFHQPGSYHNFVAVLKKVGVGCNYNCPEEEKEIYQSVKYSELTDVVATSNTITAIRNPWSVELKNIDNPFEDEEIEVVINRGSGDYSVYLVEDATGEILEISTTFQGDVYMLDQPNPNGPNLDWLTAYVAWDYEMPDGKEPSDNIRPTHVSQLKHIIADSKNKKDVTAIANNPSVNIGGKNPNQECNMNCVGDPINNFTGEFFDNKKDISANDSKLSVNLERSFSTFARNQSNNFGLGWRSNYEMKILNTNPEDSSSLNNSKSLDIENENGSRNTFRKNSEGLYEPADRNTTATLRYDSVSNNFKLERQNGEAFVFDDSGKLLKKTDEKDNEINLTYTSGKISKLSDNYSNEINISYNAQNLISSTSSNFGKSTSYVYDTKKRLTSATNERGVTFVYTYDNKNRIKTFTNELGGKTTNTYNDEDLAIKQVDPLGRATNIEYPAWYDESHDRETIITYPNGLRVSERYIHGQLTKKIENYETTNEIITHYSYNPQGLLVSEVIQDGPVRSYFYDERGNKTKEIDAYGNSMTFEYDSDNNLIKITDPYNNETINTYDNKKNLLSTTDPLGNKTTFTYDSNSNLISVTDPRGNKSNADPADYTSTMSYTNKGQLTETIDPLGNSLNFEYNSKGEIIKTRDAKNNEIVSHYNSLGLPSKVIDPLENETALTYDNMGNILTSKNAEGSITTYTYDLFGNLLTSKNSLNGITSYAYDKMDNLTKITLPSGDIQQIKYDKFSRPTQFIDELGFIKKQAYNKAGQVIRTTDEENKITKYTYNGNGEIYSITNPDGGITYYEYDKNNNLSKIIDPLERVTEYSYDANNQLIEEKKPDNTTIKTFYDEVGNIVKTINEDNKEKNYTFDSLNRQTSYTNENKQTVTYEYDKNSNLTKQIRSDNSVVNYLYDERDLLTKIDYPGVDSDIIYTYDAIGRKTSEKKGSQAVKTFEYDNLNRILEQGEENSEVSYEYNNLGDTSKITYPSGRVVDYNYNSKGYLTKLSSGTEISSDFIYNKRGQQTKASMLNRIIESTTYDDNARLNSMELLNNSAESLYKRTHEFNKANEVTERGTSVNNEALNIDKFTYNVNSKLTGQNKATDSSIVNSYNYGSTGNLNTINNKTQAFDDAGRLTTSGDSTLNYDSRNNRTSILDSTNSSENVNYEWTVDNLLKKINIGDSSSSAKTVGYDYDSSGLLKTRTEDSNTDDFVWDINREIPVILSDGEYEYIYKTNERVPFAQVNIDTDEIEYLHIDLNGSIIAATASNGELVDTVEYSPYGETEDTPVSNFGYAGEWIDKTTGYSYNKARWYDISTGVFLSEDPLVQLTQNAFGYTEGNPLTQIDPLGLWSWSDTATILGVGAAIVGVGALITVSTPVWGTALAVSATVLTISSVISSAISTTNTCTNDGSWNGEAYSNDCMWSTAGLALSAVPFVGGFSKTGKTINNLATKVNPKKSNIIDNLEQEAKITNAKIIKSNIDNLSLYSDLTKRGIDSLEKEKCK